MKWQSLSWKCAMTVLAGVVVFAGCRTAPDVGKQHAEPIRKTARAADAPKLFAKGTSNSLVRMERSVPLQVKVGHSFTYEVRIRNDTKMPLFNVTYVDVPPASVKYEGSDPAGQQVGRQIRWVLARGEEPFPAYAERVIVIECTPLYATEANLGYHGYVECSSDTTMVLQARLDVTVSAPTGTHYIGRPLTYNIAVINNGNTEAEGTSLEATVPANTKFVSATEGGKLVQGKVVWDLETLLEKESKPRSMTVLAISAGTATCTATAEVEHAKTASDSADVKLAGIPGPSIAVVAFQQIEVGENGTYKITATNRGTAVLTNVVVVCTLDQNVKYVKSSGKGTEKKGVVRFELAKLGTGGEKVTWDVTVKGTRPGDVRIKVSMTSTEVRRAVEASQASYVVPK